MHGKDPGMMTIITMGIDKEEGTNTVKGKAMDLMTIIMIERN